MMKMDPDRLAMARAQWRWRGTGRPPFADLPGPGQVSVWDFPRPPELVPDPRDIVVRWGERENGTIEVRYPWTGEVVATVPKATRGNKLSKRGCAA